jgi:hypothetical protein
MCCSRRPLLALAGVAFALGPRLAWAAPDRLTGSGVAASERRDVGAFTAVSLGAPFSLLLRPAARESVEIVADDNVLPLIETRVRGSGGQRRLEIEWPPEARIDPRTPVVITIDFVRIEAIAVGGSGRVSGGALRTDRLVASIGGSGTMSLTGIDAREVEVVIGGSGRFGGAGRTGKLALSIGGSGRCDAERLIADDVSVSLAGSADARVHADRALRASIVGSGVLFHAGAALPTLSLVGGGRVTRI